MNKEMRKEIAWMTWHANEGHIPSAYSILEILDYMYKEILNYRLDNPKWEYRDYFILSKGHGCNALYTVLKKYGFITQKDLEDKGKIDAILATHPDRTKIPGVEASTGSLGTGIGMAIGIALGLKIRKQTNRVYCMIGDGEANEGTIWESSLVAVKYNLNNLCVIADFNGSSDLILPVPNPEDKWRAFGWNVLSIDGHNMKEITNAFRLFNSYRIYTEKPTIIIAHTKKGKGVKFMEENFGFWHAKVPTEEELQQIYKGIDEYVW